ncbi:unnamed protein product [Ceratitis capitata]|uniref:Malate dehydrogenase, mitochondrial n=1 Tax=Ceratitis capitata TaxID=7213 RepID=A0A811U005_CERCA|nr:unnamed protein product [Ceratitis capitata]
MQNLKTIRCPKMIEYMYKLQYCQKNSKIILIQTTRRSLLTAHIRMDFIDEKLSFLMVPKTHPDYTQTIRLQIENKELLAWKAQLQARITSERAEVLRLKQQLSAVAAKSSNNASAAGVTTEDVAGGGVVDYEKIIEHYIRKIPYWNTKKNTCKRVFEERRECITMQVESHCKTSIYNKTLQGHRMRRLSGIGQPLSLLLKNNPLVSNLALYDIVHTPGVAADLSHIDTQSTTEGHMGPEQLGKALKSKHIHYTLLSI